MPGAAHLVLADGVVHLDPEPAVLEAMLEGWALQQRTRFLNWESTIRPRIALVRRLARFTNEYPWQWDPAEVDAFFDDLRTRRPGRPLAVSTARNYQNDLRLFFDYITDTRYGWPSTCNERFGRAPVQLLHEWNTITHTSEYEGAAERRPLTYDEVQTLFDAADGVAVPRAGARSPSRSHLPQLEAPSTRHRAPRRPQQRSSRAGHRPAGIRPRRLHRH
ncbi:phage integrase N-terminal SAM-like domain-containing protein [Streptomyces phaeochromogenes]|uniref:phage integrase N-terminal SAM-like domain-containing protein n=1 Tax=Streptomyces phaeochromogenes TaxID=1923 RepID=UPI003866FA22|nr:phage integrase N-terminal SAM-like domain-containing protein [Streptomyces phaeochromogenes]